MKKAGDFLASLLDASLMEKAAGYSKLFTSWPAVTQEVRMPSLSGHSWIRELEKSVLLVEADHPGWIQLLQTKQSELLETLRRRFPGENITGISFRLSKEGPRTDWKGR
jgi:predicted nucleic acid-binding Zn ribbon protein